jgi:glycosyltransferase involved in cell wall biosynthesis
VRILEMCTRFVPGGIQRHVVDLSAWLRSRGHDVVLGGTPGAWAQPSDPDFLPVDVHNVAAEGGPLLRRLLHLARAAAGLRPELRRRGIELIHAHESAPGLVAGMAALGTGIPVLLSYHGSEPERVREFSRIARLFATKVITPSYRSGDDLIDIGGVPRSRVEVIGLGIKPAPGVDPAEISGIRQDLLGNGKVLVITVARLAHQKGIDHLVEIVRRVCAENPHIRFAIVGDGPQREEALRWAGEAGLGDRLRFVGHSDRAEMYMAASDIFLLPSRWESLPITIVEAFRQRLPVVATDCGGVCELVDASVGRLLPIGDVAGLASAVREIAGNRSVRLALADAAFRRSGESRFDPDCVHARFEDLYRTILAGQSAH